MNYTCVFSFSAATPRWSNNFIGKHSYSEQHFALNEKSKKVKCLMSYVLWTSWLLLLNIHNITEETPLSYKITLIRQRWHSFTAILWKSGGGVTSIHLCLLCVKTFRNNRTFPIHKIDKRTNVIICGHPRTMAQQWQS